MLSHSSAVMKLCVTQMIPNISKNLKSSTVACSKTVFQKIKITLGIFSVDKCIFLFQNWKKNRRSNGKNITRFCETAEKISRKKMCLKTISMLMKKEIVLLNQQRWCYCKLFFVSWVFQFRKNVECWHINTFTHKWSQLDARHVGVSALFVQCTVMCFCFMRLVSVSSIEKHVHL